MTTHDDLTDLTDVEARLRASLRERADDVETTPALYERVERQASRGTWLRRGLALAGAAAVVAGTFVVVPSLLPEPDRGLDIADTPQDAAPTPTEGPAADDGDGAPGDAVPGDGAVDAFVEQGLAYAQDDRSGGSLVPYGPGEVAGTDAPVVSMAAAPAEGQVRLVVGLRDGTLAAVTASGGVTHLPEAAANDGGVTVSPDGEAIAWIEGTDLHIAPTADLASERVLPLEGDVPADLRLEQWVAQADAQVILASQPDGGVWSVPMDDSDVFNTAPTDPAFVLAADAVDAAILPDLRQVELVPATVGDQQTVLLRVAGEGALATPPLERADPASVELVTGADGRLVVFDRSTGDGILLDDLDTAGGAVTPRFEWQDPSMQAVVPISGPADGVAGGEVTSGDARVLGLPTSSPVIGTSGTDLLVRTSDGEVQTIEVYPAESEATLGRIAVRSGSTVEDGQVAVESFSEGESSIRFIALRDGQAAPIGDVIVTEGPVTGLVWSEGGGEVAWTDGAGLHVATVGDEGSLEGGDVRLSTDTRPVLDWAWTGFDGDLGTGHLTVATDDGTGVELLGIEETADGGLDLTGPVGGADRIVLDTHARPGAAVGPEVTAEIGTDGRVRLEWAADGDRFGELAGPVDVGGDVRIEVSGGHVIVQGADGKLLVTFDGRIVDLPLLTADWDVLD